jgi:hypothetical protein
MKDPTDDQEVRVRFRQPKGREGLHKTLELNRLIKIFSDFKEASLFCSQQLATEPAYPISQIHALFPSHTF